MEPLAGPLPSLRTVKLIVAAVPDWAATSGATETTTRSGAVRLNDEADAARLLEVAPRSKTPLSALATTTNLYEPAARAGMVTSKERATWFPAVRL